MLLFRLPCHPLAVVVITVILVLGGVGLRRGLPDGIDADNVLQTGRITVPSRGGVHFLRLVR